MIVLVCGGSNYWDVPSLFATLHCIHVDTTIKKIVHGDARGADIIAKVWALHVGVEEKAYPANWKKHGRAAGPIRNSEMLEKEKIDLVVAFPGGSGTADMVKKAQEKGIEVQFGPNFKTW